MKAGQVEEFWSDVYQHGGEASWLSEEKVRHYVNQAISGSPHEWPMDWFKRTIAASPFKDGLSIGCGEGSLERDVRKKELCNMITGIDISSRAIETAKLLAKREGIDSIHYMKEDFNKFHLPENKYDIVIFHQSLHHVEELEHCLSEVKRTLKCGGLIYLDEYIGPSRSDWNDERLTNVHHIFRALPEKMKKCDWIPLPIQLDDPSEAIRSSEIVEQVAKCFNVIEKKDYGGNVLALIYPYIKWSDLSENERSDLLDQLIKEDKAAMNNTGSSLYSLIIGIND